MHSQKKFHLFPLFSVLTAIPAHKRKQSLRAACIGGLSALLTAFIVINPLLIAAMSQWVADGIGGSIDMRAITHIGIALACIDLAAAAVGLLIRRIANASIQDAFDQIQICLSSKLYPAAPNAKESSFGLASEDLRQVISACGQALSFLAAPLTLACSLVLMFCIQWKMSLIAVCAAIIGLVSAKLIQIASKKHLRAQSEALAALNGYVEEMYSGHSTVRISRADNAIKQSFSKINDKVYKITRKTQLLSGIVPPLTGLFVHLGLIAVCVYGSKLVLTGALTLGSMAALAMYVYMSTYLLSRMARIYAQCQRCAPAAHKICSLLSVK